MDSATAHKLEKAGLVLKAITRDGQVDPIRVALFLEHFCFQADTLALEHYLDQVLPGLEGPWRT